MDPVTQGALGAALPQALAKPARIRAAALVGILAGMAPDLDVLIRSSEDPLLFLEYHRQFTHALLFIPIGGALVAALCHWLFARRWQLPFRLTLLFAVLGYSTHALLDTCTSYGTQLFWPFSSHRYAWDTVSVVDPLVTLPLLALVGAAARWRRPALAALGLAWVVAYQLAGYAQQQRALEAAWQLAAARNHAPAEIVVRPGFANILLWRSIYLTQGRFHIDGIRTGRSVTVYPGTSLAALDAARDFAWLEPDTLQARDIVRFQWFSQGFTALAPDAPWRILDIRYAFLPTDSGGLWGIEVAPRAGPERHAAYVVNRELPEGTLQRYWKMLLGH